MGLVGERRFSRQVSANESWNYTGNVVSLAGVFVATVAFGQRGVVGLMLLSATATIAAVLMIDPREINHEVARGLAHDDGAPGPSGLSILVGNKGLVLLAVTLMVFHFGNAPISRLIAELLDSTRNPDSDDCGHHRRVATLHDRHGAARSPSRKGFGLAVVFFIALCALPIRGAIAGTFTGFSVIYPVQVLDGVGAGLVGIATPIAAERILSGTGRFNVGLAAVMTVQGIGASSSNVFAGWLTQISGYSLAYWVHGAVAAIAIVVFTLARRSIAPSSADTPKEVNRSATASEGAKV